MLPLGGHVDHTVQWNTAEHGALLPSLEPNLAKVSDVNRTEDGFGIVKSALKIKKTS